MQEVKREQVVTARPRWKESLARVLRNPLARYLMQWGIRLVVPRQRIGVGLVVLDDERRVFLLRHVFHPVTPWGLPGGWLKRDESPATGVLRELKEETGLDGAVDGPLLIEHDRRPVHVGIVFSGRLFPGRIRLNSEILEARWFEPDALPEGTLPVARSAIKLALAARSQLSDPVNGLNRAI